MASILPQTAVLKILEGIPGLVTQSTTYLPDNALDVHNFVLGRHRLLEYFLRDPEVHDLTTLSHGPARRVSASCRSTC